MTCNPRKLLYKYCEPWVISNGLTRVFETVNNQVNFVDSKAGVHIQEIERSLLDAKIQIKKRCMKRRLKYYNLAAAGLRT